MKRWRARAGLLGRLERLESRAVAARPLTVSVRFGHLKRLPQDYTGERHVVITKHLPNRGDQEWVEYEEVPGQDPMRSEELDRGLPKYLDVVFVPPNPAQRQQQEHAREKAAERGRAENE